MRPIATEQNYIRYPLSAPEEAEQTGLTEAGATQAIHGLVKTGFVELFSTGRAQTSAMKRPRIALFTLLVLCCASCTSSTSQEAGSSSIASPYSAPPGAPYLAEEVRVKAEEGHVLAGTLTLPKDATGPVAAVVTITGSSPQDRDHNQPNGGDYRIFRQVADTLGRRGIAVLRMDDRGIGLSTGSFELSNTEERANDIRAGIAYLRGRAEINPNKIGLIGLSEGGLIAPMIAATDTLVSGIVLLGAPGSRGSDIVRYQVRYSIEHDPNVAPEQRDSIFRAEEAEFLAEQGKTPWVRYFWTYDPLLTARKVQNVPILIMQGRTDRHIPPGDAQKLAEAFRQAGNSDVTVHMLDGVNHILLRDPNGNPDNYSSLPSFEVDPATLGIIVDWLVIRLIT